ncbi:hypothetical protein TcasGA2_TC004247 [Tribolium castaneum]|uniref:Uncharacterized protein n=1 Tax=Tribolium castaneum TaxID=7070 RepID=D7GXX6_TRICA|nr:hypothetical protein TcasGA2_TC004247 [Tribolium castaneum]
MVYTSEQKAFLLESYFRNGEKVNGVWKYSIQPCLEEFREAFPEFSGTLTAVRYREEILTPFIEELHDEELRDGLFQQDGATAQCTAETSDFLRTFFDDRIISRNTANDYPPRSCDLTPCDFYLWPRIKNPIFVTPIPTIDELRRRIQQKINEINENPLELTNGLNSVRRRCVMCVEQQGRHFQQFL